MSSGVFTSAATSTGLPAVLGEVFERSLVCEYASLTRAGRPITWAVTPYVGQGTLDVSTGLSYPDKAERARRNPRVALLYSDPTGSGLEPAPTVLVQGRATVRDADLQAGADRYVRESLRKTSGMDGTPWFLLRRMGWYFSRIWVEVTPESVLWWPGGDLSAEPERWHADPAVQAPPSDPAPVGPRAPSRQAAPPDWRPFADRAEQLGEPVVTMNVDGHPLPVRSCGARRTGQGFQVTLPRGVDPVDGPVCLTFHRFGAGLEWQENVVLVGEAVGAGDDGLDVQVDRALNDWSLAGSKRQRTRSFLRPGKTLRKRVATEAARRGQPMPTIHRP
jgi:hypothetical protein